MFTTWMDAYDYFCGARLRSASSRKLYRLELAALTTFLGHDCLTMTPGEARAYLAHLASQSYTHATYQKKAYVLHSFFGWFSTTAHLADPFASVALPIQQVRTVSPHEVLSLEEQRDLVAAASAFSAADGLLVALLLRFGVTVSSVLALTVADVVMDANGGIGFRLYAGTRASQVVSLPEDVATLALTYLQEREQCGATCQALFLNTRGKPLTENCALRHLKRYGGASRTFSALKTSSVATMLQHGASVEEVAAIRHSTTRWLFRYASFVPKLPDSSVSQFPPLL